MGWGMVPGAAIEGRPGQQPPAIGEYGYRALRISGPLATVRAYDVELRSHDRPVTVSLMDARRRGRTLQCFEFVFLVTLPLQNGTYLTTHRCGIGSVWYTLDETSKILRVLQHKDMPWPSLPPGLSASQKPNFGGVQRGAALLRVTGLGYRVGAGNRGYTRRCRPN